MAICKNCGKGWNSWGEYDDFFSNKCKDKYSQVIKEIVQELYNISNQEIKDKIRELVEVSVYHTEVVVDILEEVFSK